MKCLKRADIISAIKIKLKIENNSKEKKKIEALKRLVIGYINVYDLSVRFTSKTYL